MRSCGSEENGKWRVKEHGSRTQHSANNYVDNCILILEDETTQSGKRKCVYTYEVWVLSVLVGAELQHSGLLPWGDFPLNNITRVMHNSRNKTATLVMLIKQLIQKF